VRHISYQLSVISYQFHAKVLRAKLLRENQLSMMIGGLDLKAIFISEAAI
jgi:hypothetical protein